MRLLRRQCGGFRLRWLNRHGLRKHRSVERFRCAHGSGVRESARRRPARHDDDSRRLRLQGAREISPSATNDHKHNGSGGGGGGFRGAPIRTVQFHRRSFGGSSRMFIWSLREKAPDRVCFPVSGLALSGLRPFRRMQRRAPARLQMNHRSLCGRSATTCRAGPGLCWCGAWAVHPVRGGRLWCPQD